MEPYVLMNLINKKIQWSHPSELTQDHAKYNFIWPMQPWYNTKKIWPHDKKKRWSYDKKKCGHMIQRKCGHVIQRKCGHVIQRKCGQVIQRKCGHVIQRKCGHVIQRKCGQSHDTSKSHVLFVSWLHDAFCHKQKASMPKCFNQQDSGLVWPNWDERFYCTLIGTTMFEQRQYNVHGQHSTCRSNETWNERICLEIILLVVHCFNEHQSLFFKLGTQQKIITVKMWKVINF